MPYLIFVELTDRMCAQFENIENLRMPSVFIHSFHSWVHQALTEHLHGPGNIKGKLSGGHPFLGFEVYSRQLWKSCSFSLG